MNNDSPIKSTLEMGSITLDSVKQALDAWRLAKERPGERVPKILWKQIIALLDKHSEVEVRCALKITPTQLSRGKFLYQAKDNPKESNNTSSVRLAPKEPIDFCEAEEEPTYPLAYKPAEAFATNTSVVELRRPDGMLMKIHICTDRFEDLLQAFFKGSVK
jgi:hypothetical protein